MRKLYNNYFLSCSGYCNIMIILASFISKIVVICKQYYLIEFQSF